MAVTASHVHGCPMTRKEAESIAIWLTSSEIADAVAGMSEDERETYAERLAICIHDGGADEETAMREGMIAVLRRRANVA